MQKKKKKLLRNGRSLFALPSVYMHLSLLQLPLQGDQRGARICWNPRLNFTISSHQLLYVSVIHISAETGSSYKACWCRSGSISCHNVDLCWEGIPRGVEAKTACIVNMAPPCWLGLNTKAFFFYPVIFERTVSCNIYAFFSSLVAEKQSEYK